MSEWAGKELRGICVKICSGICISQSCSHSSVQAVPSGRWISNVVIKVQEFTCINDKWVDRTTYWHQWGCACYFKLDSLHILHIQSLEHERCLLLPVLCSNATIWIGGWDYYPALGLKWSLRNLSMKCEIIFNELLSLKMYCKAVEVFDFQPASQVGAWNDMRLHQWLSLQCLCYWVLTEGVSVLKPG